VYFFLLSMGVRLAKKEKVIRNIRQLITNQRFRQKQMRNEVFFLG